MKKKFCLVTFLVAGIIAGTLSGCAREKEQISATTEEQSGASFSTLQEAFGFDDEKAAAINSDFEGSIESKIKSITPITVEKEDNSAFEEAGEEVMEMLGKMHHAIGVTDEGTEYYVKIASYGLLMEIRDSGLDGEVLYQIVY